jgi:membrane protein
MNELKKTIERALKVPFIHFIVDLFQRFGKDNGTFYAAGLAFFLLLAFAPLLLSGVAVLGFFINVHSASLKVEEMIQGLLPAGGARHEAVKFLTVQLHLDQQVNTIVKHRGAAGILGLLSLLWATLQIFINASVAMNAMWETSETRNWFKVRGIAAFLLFSTGAMTVISLVLSGAPTAIEKFRLPLIHHLPIPLAVLTILFEIIALLINCLMYVLIYKLLPNSKVRWYAAIVGGLTASILFEVAKKWIAVFLLRENTSIYGDLADLILFVLWIYYSMTILLLGAEVTACMERLRDGQISGKNKAVLAELKRKNLNTQERVLTTPKKRETTRKQARH